MYVIPARFWFYSFVFNEFVFGPLVRPSCILSDQIPFVKDFFLMFLKKFLAAGDGVEPSLRESKSRVLPLYKPAMDTQEIACILM